MIGLNRFKDFLLLIIIMKSSEFLTKLFIRGVTTFSLNLKMERLQGSLHSFYLLLFFSSITLCHFYFLVKNDFNPVQTGLCFASCDREALRRSPSIISEPLDATATKITHNAQGLVELILSIKPLICAGTSPTTKLNCYHLTYSQVSPTWIICKFNFLFLCC